MEPWTYKYISYRGYIYIDSRETKMTNYTNMQKGNKKLAIKPTYNFFMVRWNTQNRQI